MSYLGFPRLHFCGSFEADPSTVNNDPYHFDVAAFRAGWDEPGAGATRGWWNPDGTGAWRLAGCTVRSVAYADGSVCDDWSDPIVGARVGSATEQVAAKLVDLDPEQQMVSQPHAVGARGLGLTRHRAEPNALRQIAVIRNIHAQPHGVKRRSAERVTARTWRGSPIRSSVLRISRC